MEILGATWRFLRTAGIGAALLFYACETSAETSLEYSVKATYLYKFAAYVQWPSGAFASPTAPLVVCVVGNDPFGSTLDKAVAGQRVDGRPVQVLRVDAREADAHCHIAYLGGGDVGRVNQAAQGLRQRGALTVSDLPGSEACINFVLAGNRVRFEIDQGAAAQAGLEISSKLLHLATSVKGRPSKAPA